MRSKAADLGGSGRRNGHRSRGVWLGCGGELAGHWTLVDGWSCGSTSGLGTTLDLTYIG